MVADDLVYILNMIGNVNKKNTNFLVVLAYFIFEIYITVPYDKINMNTDSAVIVHCQQHTKTL